jgi:hypothetical protein
MTFKRRLTGANVDVAAIKRRSAGAWVTATIAKRRSAGAWVDVLPGGGAPGAVIANRTVSASVFAGTASAGYQLANTGQTQTKNGNTSAAYANVGETWLVSGVVGNYDVRATLQSGSAPTGGTLNTWENLASSRSWNLNMGAIGVVVCTLLIEIRNATTLAVVDSASIILESERG